MYDIEDEDNPHKKYTQEEINNMLAEPVVPYVVNRNEDKEYSYKDYLSWMDDVRRELINGIIYLMSGPRQVHQELLLAFANTLYDFFKKNKGQCKVFTAPFDVRFVDYEGQDDAHIKNVVQPDLFVVCDPKKLDGKGCVGAPDLVIEILSPSTRKKDQTVKFLLYEKYGVREYWIVDPKHEHVKLYVLNSHGLYNDPHIYTKNDEMRSTIFPDFVLNLADIFL